MKKTLATFCVFMAAVLQVREARAIPAFARAYNVSCSTCHTAIPRRNEFGEAFRALGYRWPKVGGEAEVETSAEERVASQAFNGSSLFRTLLPSKLPLSLSGIAEATYTGHHTTPNNDFNFSFPLIRLVGGGALSDHIGFYSSIFLITAFGAQPAVAETYLHLSQIADRPELNVRLGYFEPWTTTYKFNNQLLSDYYFVSQSPVASDRFGAEVNGVVAERIFYAASAMRNSPTTPYANYAYRVATRIGGATFLGEDLEVDLDDKRWYEPFAITVANWGFFGNNPSETGQTATTNALRRFGFDLLLTYGDTAQVFASAMVGHDSNVPTGKNLNNTAWLVEGTYFITSWLNAMYLYQHNAGTGQADVQHQTLGVTFIPVENLRATLRGSLTNAKAGDRIVDLQIWTAL